MKNIIKDQKSGKYDWNFEFNYLYHNINFNKADSLGYWAMRYGIYTGRALFVFPEYSHWVHLNNNTMPMLKVCARLKGYGHDIFAL